MYKRKKQKNKKVIVLVVAIILICLLIISLVIPRKNNSFIKDGVILVEKIIMYPFTALKNENSSTQTESYIIQKNINSSLENEIQELKEVLDLNKTLTEYEPVNATILSRNKSYWFNTITIDKGKKAGLKPNMAVVTKAGLVGKITKVSNYSSEVKLITSDDTNFKVSVAIKTNNDENYAVLNGFDKKTNQIKITDLDKTANINIGDKVLTSGLGEMFPAGIYVGEVSDIKSDKYNLSKIVYIKTEQNFNKLHYVTVLKVK